jgi:hypothetical protein
VAEEEGNIRVAVTPVITNYSAPDATRRLEVVLHRATEPAAVRLNGMPHAAYTWDADNSIVSITCEHTISANLVIEIERAVPG